MGTQLISHLGHRWIAALAAVAIAGALSASALWSGSPLAALRLGLTDHLYRLQLDAVAPRDDIVIVAIDDATLTDPRFGRWQDWQRSHFADAIDTLAAHQARAIGIDATFSEPSRDAGADAQLAGSLERAGNAIIVGRIDQSAGPVFPIDELAGTAAISFANIEPDADNIVRRSAVTLNFGTREESFGVDSFATEIARIVDPTLRHEDIPTNSTGTFLLNFFAPPKAYPSLSFADVIDEQWGDIDPTGKIFLIGATAPDLRDIAATPVSSGVLMPGIEIHANALQTILDRAFLREAPPFISVALILLAAIGGMAWFTTIRQTRYALAIAASLLGGYALLSYALFRSGIVIDVLHPALALILTFIAAYLYRYMTVEHQKRHLKRAFGHYVAAPLVERIIADHTTLKLGGERRPLTVFFSDLENFTKLSERLSAEELVTLLNTYLGRMTDIIMAHEGTLDKYIGDAVMAFWNAPLTHADHAAAACRAALEQQAALAELIQTGQLTAEIPLVVRMGIHTGESIVGNMGSLTRFNYTAMGDDVNLASRLEGVNKLYNTRILISKATYRAAGDQIEARELDTIRVKGKQTGVTIYELAGLRDTLTETQRTAYAAYAAGLAAYRAQDWSTAEQHFHAVLATIPDDGPAHTMLERIGKLRTTPPADWDGIYTLTTK